MIVKIIVTLTVLSVFFISADSVELPKGNGKKLDSIKENKKNTEEKKVDNFESRKNNAALINKSDAEEKSISNNRQNILRMANHLSQSPTNVQSLHIIQPIKQDSKIQTRGTQVRTLEKSDLSTIKEDRVLVKPNDLQSKSNISLHENNKKDKLQDVSSSHTNAQFSVKNEVNINPTKNKEENDNTDQNSIHTPDNEQNKSHKDALNQNKIASMEDELTSKVDKIESDYTLEYNDVESKVLSGNQTENYFDETNDIISEVVPCEVVKEIDSDKSADGVKKIIPAHLDQLLSNETDVKLISQRSSKENCEDTQRKNNNFVQKNILISRKDFTSPKKDFALNDKLHSQAKQRINPIDLIKNLVISNEDIREFIEKSKVKQSTVIPEHKKNKFNHLVNGNNVGNAFKWKVGSDNVLQSSKSFIPQDVNFYKPMTYDCNSYGYYRPVVNPDLTTVPIFENHHWDGNTLGYHNEQGVTCKYLNLPKQECTIENDLEYVGRTNNNNNKITDINRDWYLRPQDTQNYSNEGYFKRNLYNPYQIASQSCSVNKPYLWNSNLKGSLQSNLDCNPNFYTYNEASIPNKDSNRIWRHYHKTQVIINGNKNRNISNQNLIR